MKLNKLPSVCSTASESPKNVISRRGSRTSLNCCYPKQPIPALNIVSDKGSKNGLGCLKIKQKRTEQLLEKETDNLESCFINIMPSNDYKVKEDPPLTARVDTRITPKMIEIKLKDSCVDPLLQRHLKCLYMPRRRHFKNMTCGTQTLYRESSMQTLPYLPDISNDKETLKALELFKLPSILKGDAPPGLREVEILERARKRWSLEKTMKEKFQCSMRMARSEFARKRLLKKHKAVLEAFEWENWLEREERIQACQMLRFQLVSRIFHKREQEMYKNSNKRIQLRCEQALEKRNRALKKNEIEFGRKMRRLRIEHEKRPRNWRNDKISIQLGDPSSEYYAPQMRYGVNPNRRHFELSRKAFEMRMEDLEKRAVNMKNLACPFAKLKEWSKPKSQQIEVEQNFCSDANLQKLYENLKGLREQSQKHKTVPKCLVERAQKHAVQDENELIIEEELTEEEEEEDHEKVEHMESPIQGSNSEVIEMKRTYSRNSVIEMFPQSNDKKLSVAELLDERNHEELEIMLADYEGSTIGWLIRFLSEEMRRLQEQRKLHFLSMLAQKERWRREAREAGLRQKENEMRKIYEEMFDETEKANIDVCEQYLSNIFGVDPQEQADSEAITTVTELAKVIDADLQRWLVSFHPIQNPLNYDDLRRLLRDLVFPDELADNLRRKYETDSIVNSIVKDLFDKIIEDLEPFDVCSSIANDFVDRLIDNDLYLFSSECSSSCDCGGDCDCAPPELEASAILRKLIRHSVPGRRWRTSNERIADENVRDIIDTVCEVSKGKHRCVIVPGTRRRQHTITKASPQIDLQRRSSEEYLVPTNSESSILTSTTQEITIISYKKPKLIELDINKRLTHSEVLLWADSSKKSSTEYFESIQNLSVVEVDRDSMIRTSLKPSKSAYDMLHPEKGIITNTETSTEESYLNTKAMKAQARRIPQLTEAALITRDFVATILHEVIKNIEPTTVKTDPSITAIELETSVSYVSYQSIQSEKMSSVDLSSISQAADQSIEEESESKIDEPKYKMVMYEGELNKILYDDDDECKCQMEIDYKNHIKSLYENNQIQVICKDKPVPEQADESMKSLELTFEYSTSGFEFESSFNQDATIETDEELDIEKAAHRVTFEQSPEEFKIGLEATAEASAEKEAEPIANEQIAVDSQHAAMEEAAKVSEGQEAQPSANEQPIETAIEEVAQEAQPSANEQPVEVAQQEGTEPDANPPEET